MFLPAVGGLEVAAAEAAAALADQAGAGEAVAGDVRLAVIEGCINAIEHAYREVPAGSAPPEIELRFRLEPADPSTGSTRLVIQIRDNGCGFDLGKYEEPDLEKKLHSVRKRGWGLRLIRGFMDEFRVVSGREGTTLEMTKSLGPTRG